MVLCGQKRQPMKTTVELPDSLYRQAKAHAALRGRKLRYLVGEGLRRVLEAPLSTTRHPDLAGLMKQALGVVESGVPHLGSNPEHLTGFGRDQASPRAFGRPPGRNKLTPTSSAGMPQTAHPAA